MVDTISFVTLAAIVTIGLVIWLYNQKQASALGRMARATEDNLMISVKNRRDVHKQLPFTMTEFQWVSKQLDSEVSPIEVISVSQKPMWVNFRCADGGKRVVVSPLSHSELKPILKAQRSSSKLEQAVEPLLGMSRKNLTVKERSLRDDEWFDLEADAIGKQCGVDWGETSRLYFYIVAPKESK